GDSCLPRVATNGVALRGAVPGRGIATLGKRQIDCITNTLITSLDRAQCSRRELQGQMADAAPVAGTSGIRASVIRPTSHRSVLNHQRDCSLMRSGAAGTGRGDLNDLLG